MGQAVAASKSVAVVVACAAVEVGIIHFRNNSLEGAKTHQAPFQLFIVCQCGAMV
jgi:hypothetical protein